MSPETVLALFRQQLDSFLPEMEVAARKGYRFRITLYMGEEFIGEPHFVPLPKRRFDKTSPDTLELAATK